MSKEPDITEEIRATLDHLGLPHYSCSSQPVEVLNVIDELIEIGRVQPYQGYLMQVTIKEEIETMT